MLLIKLSHFHEVLKMMKISADVCEKVELPFQNGKIKLQIVYFNNNY